MEQAMIPNLVILGGVYVQVDAITAAKPPKQNDCGDIVTWCLISGQWISFTDSYSKVWDAVLTAKGWK